MIYGTPSHDTEGSLEVFESIKARHQVTILRPGIAYGLGDFRIYELAKSGENGRARALLFGVPEPNKKWLLANAGAIGKGEADEAVRSAMGALFLRLGGMRRHHPELPCVLMYHGQVAGSKSGTGFTVETGSGLSVMRDQLATVGGRLHRPRRHPRTATDRRDPGLLSGEYLPDQLGRDASDRVQRRRNRQRRLGPDAQRCALRRP